MSHYDVVQALKGYVLAHGGPDRHDFLITLGWLERLIAAAQDATNPELIINPEKQDEAIDHLRRCLRDKH